MEENLALDKEFQKKFAKKVRKVKERIESSNIVESEIKPKKSKPTRGTVYIGHIPHGFYENEMLAYFKQFGKVTNVRVSRSRATGQSKGYAFVEFLHEEVAQVVAETMNNYLMFNRRLIAKCIPTKSQHRRMFRKGPWSKKRCPTKSMREEVNRERNRNISDAKQAIKNKEIISKINKNLKKLEDLGISYSFKVTDDFSKEIPTSNEPEPSNKVDKTKGKDVLKKIKTKKVLRTK